MARLLLVLGFVVSTITGMAQASTSWTFEKVHEPRYFRIDQRSMVVDGAGNPHIFYGGNHLYHSYYNGSQWLRETIDPAPRSGRAASVAMDSSGKFHVLYVDDYKSIADSGINAVVTKYATNASGQWVIEQLPGPLGCGEWCAIAVDSIGRPHIAYYDNLKIMHATKLPTGWQSEMIDENTNLAPRGDLSLAIDGSNNAHVVYHWVAIEQNSYENYLKHATNATGNWVNEKIDNRSTAYAIYYEHNSLVLDGNGSAHVAYLGVDGLLYYATNAGGAWIPQVVDDSIRPDGMRFNGKYPSVALDQNGKVHISYMSAQGSPAAEIVRYATNLSGTWALQSLETANSFSTNIALVAAASGQIHIAYFDVGTRSLRYFTNPSLNWSAVSIDFSEEGMSPGSMPDFDPVGVFSSIARDSQGKLHVSYVKSLGDTLLTHGQDDGVLMYANNASGNWTTQTLPSATVGVQQTAVATDSSGKIHIAFLSSFGLDINYVTNRNGTWVLTKLESTNWTYDHKRGIGIAIDGSGHVHVAYFVEGGGGFGMPESAKLRYATNRSGAWQIETVTTITADLGYSLASDASAALTLDVSGRAHIGFLDGSGHVSYATNATGTWAVKTVAVIDKVYRWGEQSMVVEPTGIVHMAFQSLYCTGGTCFNLGIEYASNTTGSWEREFVDDDVYLDSVSHSGMLSPALVLDSTGGPHISYQYYATRDAFPTGLISQNLRYAHKVGSLWRISIIESDFYVGEYNDIVTDASGNAFIAYHDEPNGSLKVAKSTQVPSPLMNVSVSPDNLDFGDVQVAAQASRLITLQNLGQLGLSVSSVELADGTPGFTLDFSAGSQPCGRGVNLTLVPGSHCTFALLFAPTTSGQNTATLLITSNDPELPLLGGEFTGNATAPSPSSSAASGGGGGGGGGCTISDSTNVDPTLAFLLIISFLFLWRRRTQVVWKDHLDLRLV